MRKKSIDELYDSQFEDLYILWLYTFGSRKIYQLIMEEQGLRPKIFSHACAYCIEIIADNQNVDVLKKIVKRHIPNILYQLELINKEYKL